MFLLDTNVISETRRPRPHGGVVAWLDAHRRHTIQIAAVSIGEIQRGIEITREQDPDRAAQLEAWLEQVADEWTVITADVPIYRAWARLMHGQPRQLAEDAMVAATALVRGLAVVTRNTRDFASFGVRVLNPFLPMP